MSPITVLTVVIAIATAVKEVLKDEEKQINQLSIQGGSILFKKINPNNLKTKK